jgi:hypothetical protein
MEKAERLREVKKKLKPFQMIEVVKDSQDLRKN